MKISYCAGNGNLFFEEIKIEVCKGDKSYEEVDEMEDSLNNNAAAKIENFSIQFK